MTYLKMLCVFFGTNFVWIKSSDSIFSKESLKTHFFSVGQSDSAEVQASQLLVSTTCRGRACPPAPAMTALAA